MGRRERQSRNSVQGTYWVSDILHDIRKAFAEARECIVEVRGTVTDDGLLRGASCRFDGVSIGENIKSRMKLDVIAHGGWVKRASGQPFAGPKLNTILAIT